MSVVGLQKDPDHVEQCVCIIVYIYTECIRNQVNPLDFGDVIQAIGVAANQINVLEKVYNQIVYLFSHQVICSLSL